MTSLPRIRLGDKIKQGSAMLSILIILISFFLSWFAISYQNKNATNGYFVKKLQQQRTDLLYQIETLEMEIADLGVLRDKSVE